MLEAEEGTSSTIRAVVPIFLSRVEIAGRWWHRRRWSWWRGRRWSAVQVEGGKDGLAASRLLHSQDFSLTLDYRRMVGRTSRWRWIRQALWFT